jgi:hypothetical protein
VDGLGHDEGLPSRLKVPNHARVVEATIQQEKLGVDACGDDPATEFTDDLTHRCAAFDGEDGEREAESVANDEGGGVAVEVGGAVLGLASEDLVLGDEVVPVVGDQGGVDGDDPPTASQAPGQRGIEQEAESAVEGIAIDELPGQVAPDGVGVGCVCEPGTGVADRGDATGRIGEDGDDDVAGADANGRPDPKEWGEKLAGQVLDVVGTEGMLHATQG